MRCLAGREQTLAALSRRLRPERGCEERR